MTSCLAPHVAPVQLDYKRLAWIRPPGDSRRRVIAWTCDCQDVIYELCSSGGQAFLTRTHEGRSLSLETHRASLCEARATWHALLTGLAR
ncbi:hypothetical protein GCM10023193_52880 [Planotetraspora kaengkrachanensis]